jgi:hypothetical protein
MRRVLKIVLIVAAVFLGLVIALFQYSVNRDRERFAAAKNDCERACIQDSGGLDQCRELCKGHPDRYP